MANEEHVKILKRGVRAWNKWREKNHEIAPDLSYLDLSNANLHDANLRFTNLSHSNLNNADLRADLTGAVLIHANLTKANLRGADLGHANLSGANLAGADLTEAWIGGSTFGFNDLSVIKGLDTTLHFGPSSIGIESIYRSEGNVSEIFLQEAGVSESFITYMHSLTIQPIQFYSCFISYSSKNQAFAEQLHSNLQDKGVRCWFAPKDLKIGEKTRTYIDESIKIHEKVLLILSKNSVASEWVEKEVEAALEQERQRKRTVLFPIRLDDTVMKVESGWAADIRRSRNIGDFRHWRNPEIYANALERLLRDLKAEDSK